MPWSHRAIVRACAYLEDVLAEARLASPAEREVTLARLGHLAGVDLRSDGSVWLPAFGRMMVLGTIRIVGRSPEGNRLWALSPQAIIDSHPGVER